MPAQHRVIIIAKERPFDAEKWKELLTAFAYVLHERRKAHTQDTPPVASATDTPEMPETSQGSS